MDTGEGTAEKEISEAEAEYVSSDSTVVAKDEKIEREQEPLEIDRIRGEIDLEKRPVGPERQKSNRSVPEENMVTWDGPDDPANPKNWSLKRRWAATFIVSCFTFISPCSSSMVAPALVPISREFSIGTEEEAALVLSVFVLAYAFGPLLLGPLSEVYGRVIVLQLANLFYLVFNTAGGFATSKVQLIVFRFLSGLGGSAPLAIGGGVLSDCWRAEERGKAISIYLLAPLLGPAIGPLAGGFIVQSTTWRWIFWATSAADALIQVLGLFLLQETYPPRLLAIKARKLRRETGNANLHTEWETPDRTLPKVLKTALIRPFRLLATQPIVQAVAVYMAFVYGLMYLVFSTFPSVWAEAYNESAAIGGLNYIAIALGFSLGAQLTGLLQDRLYRHLTKQRGGVGVPEYRVPLMLPGACIVPVGLFLYGWSAQRRWHWIVTDVASVIFSTGIIIGYQCMQTYLVDAYQTYAASAMAAAIFLRSLAGFGFPLFAPTMYSHLGLGWGNSLLAFVAIGLGIPAPILLWIYGCALREKSRFAAG